MGKNNQKKKKKNKMQKKVKQAAPPPKAKKLTLQERFKNKLEGGQFRMLNESLYTTTGKSAFERFQKDKQATNGKMFQAYHSGFSKQVEKWPVNPVDTILEMILHVSDHAKELPLQVADLGCGEAQIGLELKDDEAVEVHSFDLVAR